MWKKCVCSLDKNWFYTTGVALGTREACLSMDRVSNGKVGKAPPWDLVSVQAKLLYCCMFWLQRRYKQAWCMHTLRSIRAAVLFGSWIAQLDCLPSSWTKCDRRSHAGCRCVMYVSQSCCDLAAFTEVCWFSGYVYVRDSVTSFLRFSAYFY